MELRKLIEKYALANAVKFDGKATAGAVIGKVLAENPSLKERMKEVSKDINSIVLEINKLSMEEQQKHFEEYKDEFPPAEKQEKDIFSVFHIQSNEKVVTAFPPEPSKYPHIGHAKAAFLNYELAKKHNGTFILRFEDTNPELADDIYYKIHLENYEWLGIHPDKVLYVSDFMETFYEKTEELLKKGHAYVDRASLDEQRKSRLTGIPTKDRDTKPVENLKRWKEMATLPEGSCTVRLKIDLAHQNSAMRDPTIMRIIDKPHPRTGTKYRVWPNYDFENSVMDGLFGITHRLRTKEFELRNELQGYIQELFGYPKAKIYEFARFNMEGVESSGRIIREKIENKELVGWDDPSLTTLVALRRRGFQPEAIKSFVLSTGVTKNEATLTWDDLILHNKRFLDAKVKRLFMIQHPKDIHIKNAPEQELLIKMHPEVDLGKRKMHTNQDFIVENLDYQRFHEGKMYRLMDCLNFKKEYNVLIYHSKGYGDYSKAKGDAIIHWLPKEEKIIPIEIIMPDKSLVSAFGEHELLNLHENEVIQFTRFGFCRLDKKEKGKLRFWFTHK